MKTIYLFLSLMLLFPSCERKSARMPFKNCDYTVVVTGITDGDTFKGLTADKQEIKFRIYGIDTPEKKQAFGNKSKRPL
jgi:endonuclease YncB( thermonuclease family)